MRILTLKLILLLKLIVICRRPTTNDRRLTVMLSAAATKVAAESKHPYEFHDSRGLGDNLASKPTRTRCPRQENHSRNGNAEFLWGIPPPPWSSGIIDLGEDFEIIYGAQQLTGKLFIRKYLAPAGCFARIPLPPWSVSAWWIVRRKDWDHRGV